MIGVLGQFSFSLMAILKGNVRFSVDLLLLRTLSFYGLSLNQCLPNFYRVASSMSCLNSLYSLGLNHHDINFQYNICSGLKNGYYLKTRNPIVRLISCLPDSNWNSVEEFIKVSGNWLTSELSCPTSPQQISQYLCFPEHKQCRVDCLYPTFPCLIFAYISLSLFIILPFYFIYYFVCVCIYIYIYKF